MKLVIFIFASVFMLNECVDDEMVPHRPFNTTKEIENYFFETFDENEVPVWTDEEKLDMIRICHTVYCANYARMSKYKELIKLDKNCDTQWRQKEIIEGRRSSSADKLQKVADVIYCDCRTSKSMNLKFSIVKDFKPNSYFLLDDFLVPMSDELHYSFHSYLELKKSNIVPFKFFPS